MEWEMTMATHIDAPTTPRQPRTRSPAHPQPAARTLALQPITTNVSFRDQAYSAIKQAIMDADIYAHREELRLDERQLSQALGVSRTPIREAMGISQHVHGTDNARCLIALSMMTGQVGRPGTGLHPLRGQNNVQGASDVGLIPMMYPDYQRVDNAGTRSRFEQVWGTTLDPQPGLTVVEIMMLQIVLLCIFPEIATWLPDHLMGAVH